MVDLTQCKAAFDLIREYATIAQVQDVLRDKGAHHSAGSWDVLWNDRVKPALEEEKVSETDLLELLGYAQEYGRQHIFLYRPVARKRPDRILDPDVLYPLLKEQEMFEKLGCVDLSMHPNGLELVEIRNEPQESLTFVFAEPKRVVARTEDIVFFKDGLEAHQRTKFYKTVRLVHVVEMEKSGALEIRVGSHSAELREQRKKNHYLVQAHNLMNRLRGVVPWADLDVKSLSKVKNSITVDASRYGDVLRTTESTLHNELSIINASTKKPDSDLFSDQGSTSAVDAYRQYNADCEESYLVFLPQESGVPSREIRVVLKGAINEFFFTSHITREEYDYVKKFLRRVS